jgi:hypothetical protein
LKSSGSSQPSRGEDRDSALRALDKALRDALVTLPRDEIIQHVAVALADEGSEGHDLDSASAAIKRQVRQHNLGELLDELEAEHGTVPKAVREQTRRMWPNYEEGG